MYDLAIGLHIDLPNACDQSESDAWLSIAIMPRLRQLTMMNSLRLSMGSTDKLKTCLEKAFEVAAKLHSTFQSMLSSFFDNASDQVMKT